eukprot:g3650.t1
MCFGLPLVRSSGRGAALRRVSEGGEEGGDVFADIDFTRSRRAEGGAQAAAEAGGGGGGDVSFKAVQPSAAAKVADWRSPASYNEVGEAMSEEALRRHAKPADRGRVHVGPSVSQVQVALPGPGSSLAQKHVPRTPLARLHKQIGVVCLRDQVDHFGGRGDATVGGDELAAANGRATALAGAGGVLAPAEAAAWAPQLCQLRGR